MQRRHHFSLPMLCGLSCLIAPFAGPHAARAADAAHPMVVELFQSQGCSSCPPANANLLALADRPDVLTLSWQVTYWDDLGWKDTFDNPAFTARQWDYAHAFHRQEVFTPQIVVNGRQDTVGADRVELERVMASADRGLSGPTITIAGAHVTISGVTEPVSALLVRYDPRIIQVPILRGENGGRTLPHRNVVRAVSLLGSWRDGVRNFDLPGGADPNLRSAVLVQAGPGGAVLAAARVD